MKTYLGENVTNIVEGTEITIAEKVNGRWMDVDNFTNIPRYMHLLEDCFGEANTIEDVCMYVENFADFYNVELQVFEEEL